MKDEEKVAVKSLYYGKPVNLKIEMTDYEATMIWDILNESILNCPSKTFKTHAKKFFIIYQEALLKAGLPNLPKSGNGSCLDK